MMAVYTHVSFKICPSNKYTNDMDICTTLNAVSRICAWGSALPLPTYFLLSSPLIQIRGLKNAVNSPVGSVTTHTF